MRTVYLNGTYSPAPAMRAAGVLRGSREEHALGVRAASLPRVRCAVARTEWQLRCEYTAASRCIDQFRSMCSQLMSVCVCGGCVCLKGARESVQASRSAGQREMSSPESARAARGRDSNRWWRHEERCCRSSECLLRDAGTGSRLARKQASEKARERETSSHTEATVPSLSHLTVSREAAAVA